MIDKFSVVREDLHRRYDNSCGADVVDQIVDDEISNHKNVKIADFVPVMVERDSSERLAEIAESAGFDKPRQEILFVCERNAGRSQLAAAITHHLVGENVFVRSVGLHPTGGINPQVLEVLDERGIARDGLYQKSIVPRVVHTADVVVLLGVDDIPGIPANRVIHWDIEDPEGKDKETVGYIANDIEVHVKQLLKEMGVR